MCVTLEYLGSIGSTVRKSAFTGSTFLHLALDNIVCRVENRLRSLSKAKSLPILFIRALKCEVLLPGAEVASITTLSTDAGGLRTRAGKHEALSWRMTFPVLYASSSWKDS